MTIVSRAAHVRRGIAHSQLVAAWARLYFLSWLAGRSWTLSLVAYRVVPPLIGLAVWRTALPGRPDIAGYYVVLLFVRLVVDSPENYTVSPRIYDGSLTEDLLRPRPVVLNPLGWNLGIRAYNLVIVAPIAVLVGLLVGANLRPTKLLLAVPALVLAATIRFLFTYTLALTAFWTQRADAVVNGGQVLIFLLGGEAAPLLFLPRQLRLFAAVLPLRFMIGFPAEVASGLSRGPAIWHGYAVQAAWVAAALVLNRWVWQAGLRRYTAVGG